MSNLKPPTEETQTVKKDPLRFKDTNKTASNKEFCLVFAAFFLIISLIPLVHKEPIRVWTIPISFVFLLAYFFKPAIVSPLNKLWTKLGLLLHKIVSPVILGAVYYIVFFTTSLFLKLIKKDPLLLKTKKESNSYWLKREDENNMANQF